MTVRNRIQAGDGDARHGTVNGYNKHRCRCGSCREAWATYCRALARRRAAVLTPDDPRHGLYTTYRNYGCRCRACTEAQGDSMRARRARLAGAR